MGWVLTDAHTHVTKTPFKTEHCWDEGRVPWSPFPCHPGFYPSLPQITAFLLTFYYRLAFLVLELHLLGITEWRLACKSSFTAGCVCCHLRCCRSQLFVSLLGATALCERTTVTCVPLARSVSHTGAGAPADMAMLHPHERAVSHFRSSVE